MAGMYGIPWAWTDPRDAAYRNPNTPIAANTGKPFEGGFNLHQWFIDQGVTNPTYQSYYRYAQIRGIDPGVMGPGELWKDPYNYNGIGNPDDTGFTVAPQNKAEGVSVDQNSAIYDKNHATALANAANRTRLNAVGSGYTDPAATAQPLNLAKPTLLGGA